MSAQLQQPPNPQMAQREQEEKLLEQILGGELPGKGYLYADDPEKRQEQMVKTTPEFVRDTLLRATEVLGFDLQLPFSPEKKSELAKAVLACAQAFLLLDPSVDAEGVSIEGRAETEAKFPPRIAPNPAEKAVAEKNKPKTQALSGTRPDQPRPKPRVNG